LQASSDGQRLMGVAPRYGLMGTGLGSGV